MRISVNADNREYSVQIGPGMIKEEGLFTGFRRAAVVTDETVAKLHLDTIMATLERAKVRAGSIILPPGEEPRTGGACPSYTVPPRCWPRRIPPSGERWP